MPQSRRYPPYLESADQRAEDYAEVAAALRGEIGWGRRAVGTEGNILSVAVPVQAFKKVQGALFVTAADDDVEQGVRVARIAILQVFAVALGVTVLLSLFLAGTIARPVRRLAESADRVRRITGRRVEIPDFTRREDEIGDLSGALRDMTRSLYARLDAIETFAADVSHEIKNPLTSLHSAVETFARVEEPAQRERLLQVIKADVIRLDRLISDISDASRLDAELSRTEFEPIDVGALARALVEVYRATATAEAPELVLDIDDHDDLTVLGAENRLGRVLRNLIDNAVTFSPPGGRIGLAAWRDGDNVVLMVEDEGPGIPEDKLGAVFERFYSARPEGEAFGSHSGLGLSISKQIIEAHGGTIVARNRREPMGNVVGARFIARLPAAKAGGRRQSGGAARD
jgi:two-component system sensor histidine kinase ChvG